MSKHIATNTQGAHPWRATFRTVLVALIALAAMADVIFEAIAQGNEAAANGGFAGALAISAALTRVLALPAVDAFLVRFAPWLSAAGRAKPEPVPVPVDLHAPEPEVIQGEFLDIGATEYSHPRE